MKLSVATQRLSRVSMRRRWTPAFGVALLAVSVAACSSGSGGTSSSNTSTAATTTSSASTPASAAPSSSAEASSGGTAASSDFYKGKTFTLVVAGAPGGDMDVSARIVAPFLQKAIGASAVKVVDVKGAGGVIGFNQIWGSSNDGFTIGYGSMTTLITTSVVGGSSIKYDASKFVYIGRSALLTPRVVAVSAKAHIDNLDQLKAASKVIFSAQGFNDDFYTAAAFSKTVGLKNKFVTGFDSAAAELQALGAGSTTAIESSIAEITSLFKSGLAKPIVMINDTPVPGYENVPLWTSVVSADQKPLAEAFQAVIDFGRSFIAPPGFPADAAAAMSAGLKTALQDPGLLSQMQKLGVPISYMSSSDEQTGVEASVATLKANISVLTDAKQQVQG